MLLSSQVPRALETKTKLFGFELSDLLLIFLYLSVSNLLLGTLRIKLWISWGGTFLLAASLFFLKRGKPDNYLQHLGEFYRSPGIFSAGLGDSSFRPYFLESAPQADQEKKR